MEKICEKMIFKQAYPYVDDAVVHGVMSKFNPGDRILKAGTQLHPACSPLKHDLRMLQDVAVKMRDGVTIYTDIYLPADVAGCGTGGFAVGAPCYKHGHFIPLLHIGRKIYVSIDCYAVAHLNRNILKHAQVMLQR